MQGDKRINRNVRSEGHQAVASSQNCRWEINSPDKLVEKHFVMFGDVYFTCAK